jgi:glycosyltransferase involved in cell wall biosynthesis
MKIVYVLDTIRGLGGIERIISTKANSLAAIDGNEVYIVSIKDKKNLQQLFELSPSVHVINTNIIDYQWNPSYSNLVNCIKSWSEKFTYRSKLQCVIDEISPDIVITCGKSDKYLYPSKHNRKWKLIREFHEGKDAEIRISPTKFLKFVFRMMTFVDQTFNVSKCDKVVLLTQEEQERFWHGKKNVVVIPNPVSIKCDNPSTLEEKCVISVGRLDQFKNFGALIRAFRTVCRKHQDWVLRIYGEGVEREALQQLIVQEGLQENVFLMGFTGNMVEALRHASIFGFSSLTEGLPLVLIEAMECGVPVVSYQCHNGPKDIITDGVDGFLVPVGDEQMLAEKICTIIENRQLHQSMGRAAKEKAKNYQLNIIIDRWMSLFNELVYFKN